MRPIIFLDVDGVLNHRGVFTPRNGPDPLCSAAVYRLIGLVVTTKSEVVISSTWRLGGFDSSSMRKVRNAIGKYLHDDWRTIDLPWVIENGIIVDETRRGREIAEWLSRHADVKRFVILDDDSDMLAEQIPHFVQTSFTEGGLLEEHCVRASKILLDE